MHLVRLLGGLILVAAATSILSADEEEQNREGAARLKQMEQVAHSMSFHDSIDGQRKDVRLVDKPVLRFSDTPRADIDGTLWIVGNEGRPYAMMIVYTKGTFPPGRWIQAVTSLSTTATVTGRNINGQNWTPNAPGVLMKTFSNAPAPAKIAKERSRQMKELARLFTGHEFWPADSRHELRLLIQPLHRYQDPAAGVTDGAVFALAHDTNPEVLVLIEACEDSSWRYGLARFGYAQLHVNLRDEEVWTQQIISSTASNEPYWLFHLTLGN